MAAVVIIIGSTNLLLGYGLAVFVRRMLDAGTFRWCLPRLKFVLPRRHVVEADGFDPASTASPADDRLLEPIPADWLQKLDEKAIQPGSFVEAAAQVLRLDFGKYHEALVDLEAQFRPALDETHNAALTAIASRFAAIHRAWQSELASTNEHLARHASTLGQYSDIGAALCRVLDDQQTQIDTAWRAIDALDLGQAESASPQIANGFAQLFALGDALRDKLRAALQATRGGGF